MMTREGLRSFNDLAAAQAAALHEESIVIDGRTIFCAVSRGGLGGDMGLGGDIPEAILKVQLPIRHFGSDYRPVHGQTTLEYDGRTWRVDEVGSAQNLKYWPLTCVPASEK